MIWDGADGCDHEWGDERRKTTGRNDGDRARLSAGSYDGGGEDKYYVGKQEASQGQFCTHCNAWRGQLGLEPTIELYLDHLLQIFNEVGRVMKDEGTLWVNLGDSYSASGGSGSEEYSKRHTQFGKVIDQGTKVLPRNVKSLPAKSLCGIPERFVLAMTDPTYRGLIEWMAAGEPKGQLEEYIDQARANVWINIRRNTIIWHKPSCMPSSAKDRFTVDFEYIYFFVKQQKYWFEQQFEPHVEPERGGHESNNPHSGRIDDSDRQAASWVPGERAYNPQGRNKRAVWTINTQPYPEAHFATFPEKLVEPMILAGCPEFVCPECGKGREAIIDTKYELAGGKGNEKYGENTPDDNTNPGPQGMKYGRANAIRTKTGLTDCGCAAGWKPGITLDPFIGAGTVGKVAKRLRRDWLGIDLSDEYVEMGEKRIDIIKYAEEHPEYKKEGLFF